MIVAPKKIQKFSLVFFGKTKKTQKSTVVNTFYCFLKHFTDKLQNLRAKQYSLKNMNDNMSKMYYTKITFLAQKNAFKFNNPNF